MCECVCECVCVCVCVCWFVGGLRCSFATLLQTLASTEEASGRIFGFTAAAVTIIDAVVVLSLSLMFQNFQSDRQIVPLGAAAALFALIGIGDWLLGPYLFFDTPAAGAGATIRQPLLQ